ncbi:uncharacterized protein [Gossypium hirsutum]|uniref:Uncharacterized protein n=1 Tax=Gossypium hirsutum TaxID=3635 RepID=A0A1U8PLI1_GOSHI|nr:uncharacterized protein LOC107959491 [Gossypium hirsutum]
MEKALFFFHSSTLSLIFLPSFNFFHLLLHTGKFYTLLFRFLSSPLSQDLIPLRKIQNLNHHSLVLFNLRVRIFAIAVKRRGGGRKRTNPIAGNLTRLLPSLLIYFN